jgi:hypothetical protein
LSSAAALRAASTLTALRLLTLRRSYAKHSAAKNSLLTDEARHYMEVGREFKSHDAVNHGKDQYVRYWNEVTDKTRPGGKPIVKTTTITTNTAKASIRFSTAA